MEVENEGDVNQYKNFPNGKGTFWVVKEEAEKLSGEYGVLIT